MATYGSISQNFILILLPILVILIVLSSIRLMKSSSASVYNVGLILTAIRTLLVSSLSLEIGVGLLDLFIQLLLIMLIESKIVEFFWFLATFILFTYAIL